MRCEDRSTSSCESGCNCFTTLCEECIRFDVKIKALRVVRVDVIVLPLCECLCESGILVTEEPLIDGGCA